jgi:hypothetical protein
VVARHGLQRVDIIDADLMIAEELWEMRRYARLSILGSCAEIACRHLGVEPHNRADAIISV